jgi:cell wall assembly regulator SMI1
VRRAEYEHLAERVHRDLGAIFEWNVSPGASADALAKCELALGHPLPAEFRAFLEVNDGVEASIDLPEPLFGDNLRILGAEEAVSATLAQRGDSWQDRANSWTDLLAIADVEDGNYLAIDLSGEGPVGSIRGIYNDVVVRFREESPIASSFDDWLVKVLDYASKTRAYFCYWLDPNRST